MFIISILSKKAGRRAAAAHPVKSGAAHATRRVQRAALAARMPHKRGKRAVRLLFYSFHCQSDAFLVVVDGNNLYLDRVADRNDIHRVLDILIA